jgi:hypothetical protein
MLLEFLGILKLKHIQCKSLFTRAIAVAQDTHMVEKMSAHDLLTLLSHSTGLKHFREGDFARSAFKHHLPKFIATI